MDRLLHVILGAYLAAAFLVLSVSAFYLIKGRFREIAISSMKIGLVVAALASLVQLASGHRSAGVVVDHQPAILAAFEGLFETQAQAPLHLFGWLDTTNRRVIGIAVPGALSLLAHDNLDAEVTGLDAFDRSDTPPVQATFQFFHLMVAVGMALIGISWLGILLWWRGSLFDTSQRLSRAYLWLLVFAVLLPQIANQSGWFTAEIGRQPWIVYGLLRTSQGLSEAVEAGQVLFSLTLFGLIYALLFALFIFLLDRKIRQGPVTEAAMETSAKRYVPSADKEPHA